MPRWVLTITATRMAGILLLSLVVATVDTLGVVLWRVCASHYRERLPVSAFLYLYPRLNSYGTASGQHADQLSIQPSRNCVPRSRPRADAKRFTIVPSSRLRQLAEKTLLLPARIADPREIDAVQMADFSVS